MDYGTHLSDAERKVKENVIVEPGVDVEGRIVTTWHHQRNTSLEREDYGAVNAKENMILSISTCPCVCAEQEPQSRGQMFFLCSSLSVPTAAMHARVRCVTAARNKKG